MNIIYVALLRGINVGGKNKVDMKRLKLSFESIGLKSVTTYINSGNILFESETQDIALLKAQIEDILLKDFGLNLKVLLRDFSRYQEMMQQIPTEYSNNEDTKCDVLFLMDDIDSPSVLNELPSKQGIDRFIYVPGAILSILDRKKLTKSGLMKLSGHYLYQKMTVRNINTTRKINELMKEM